MVAEAPASAATVSSPSEPPSALAAAAAASAAQANVPKPVQAAPTTAAAGLRKLKSTVKIPSSLQSARQMAAHSATEAEQKAATAGEQEQQVGAALPDQDYSKEQFMAAWKQYSEQVKASGRQGEYIVLKEAPDLPGNHLVQVRITNSVQQDFFEKARHGAQQFMRKALQNSQISLECIMVKEVEGTRLYTAQEKFGYLLKKYPQLKELKERLGLEADF